MLCPAVSVFLFIHSLITIQKQTIMEKKMNYIAPEVEVLEVAVEQGFAQSGGPDFIPFGPEQDWE